MRWRGCGFRRRKKEGRRLVGGYFDDTIKVYTSPSGRQYVTREDVRRLSPEEFRREVLEVGETMKRELAERDAEADSAAE